MPLDALRPAPLVEQAAQRLKEEIASERWPIGAKLPAEAVLAKTLGVGRSTVREALRALAGAGLVQSRQGAGVFVIAHLAAEDWSARLRQAAITDLYEVRALIEVEAAKLAAERRTDADMAALEKTLAARRQAASGGNVEFVDADISLHAAIVAAAHNPVLTSLFAEFTPLLQQGLVDLLDLTGLRKAEPAHGEETHVQMVDAVARGDSEAAGRIVKAELQQTLGRLHAM